MRTLKICSHTSEKRPNRGEAEEKEEESYFLPESIQFFVLGAMSIQLEAPEQGAYQSEENL